METRNTSDGASQPAEVATDGRRRRRERGRVAVVDAMIDLILDGGQSPTAAQIADSADVSIASVYRYFDSLDELRRLGVQRYLERIDHLIAIPDIGAGPLVERVEAFVASRLEFYRITEPIARLSRRQAFDIEEMRTTISRLRATLADQVAQQFTPELAALAPAARQDRVAAIAVLTSFESWDLMQDQGLDRAAIRRAWRTGLTRLLSG